MENQIRKIELLYFEDCPSWRTAKKYLVEVLDEFGIDCGFTMKRIETTDEAILHKFPGSPTIRLDRIDLFPVNYTDYTLGCRVYETPQGLKGSPTKEMISEKLKGLIKHLRPKFSL